MPETGEATTFTCAHCGRTIASASHGTRFRNHCPWCLWSVHVASSRVQDDRASECRGHMEPIAVSLQDREWALVHRCQKCGVIKTNRLAGDDDMFAALVLALRPLANMPVPLELIPEEVRAMYAQLGSKSQTE